MLTSLLVSAGVHDVVVCPGSRNAPLVHNFNECSEMRCYPVTDERSAAFFALGIRQATGRKVAVCVTSGTALLNLAPGVAEATYQHHGLIVISADRPAAWIGHNDGQTMPQPGSLGCFVAKSVSLPEIHDDTDRWHCRCLVDEALLANERVNSPSVHINVPISEPLFEFSVPSLPDVRHVKLVKRKPDVKAFTDVLDRLVNAKRPMIVVGQLPYYDDAVREMFMNLRNEIHVITECLSGPSVYSCDWAINKMEKEELYQPTCLLYCGGNLVSKRLKQFLRNNPSCETWELSADGEMHDTFQSLGCIIEGSLEEFAEAVIDFRRSHKTARDENEKERIEFLTRWNMICEASADAITDYIPEYSQMLAVREFELSVEDMEYPSYAVHYANSFAVRLGNLYASRYSFCNRGINGIEGSVSTAAGYAVASGILTFCITGDLSFFYDSNALWNTFPEIPLRILLLNNGGGAIFHSLKGLGESDAADMVEGRHSTSARGLCEAHDAGYIAAHDEQELRKGMVTFLNSDTRRPLVFEVFTDAETDNCVYDKFLHGEV